MADRHETLRRAPPHPTPQPLTDEELERNVKILARVLYRDLRSKGFSNGQIIAIVAELFQCVLNERHAPAA